MISSASRELFEWHDFGTKNYTLVLRGVISGAIIHLQPLAFNVDYAESFHATIIDKASGTTQPAVPLRREVKIRMVLRTLPELYDTLEKYEVFMFTHIKDKAEYVRHFMQTGKKDKTILECKAMFNNAEYKVQRKRHKHNNESYVTLTLSLIGDIRYDRD